MDEQKNRGDGFFTNILTTFANSIIVISIIGFIIGDLGKEAGGVFALGREGLSYKSILQIFICAVVLGGLRTLVLSDLIFKNMMLLWKTIILLFLSFVSVSIFSVLFVWFPLEIWEAWVSFALTYIACFVVSSAVMIIKTRIEDKKYIRLLSEYKAKQKNESGE